jgi:hypothetical protein
VKWKTAGRHVLVVGVPLRVAHRQHTRRGLPPRRRRGNDQMACGHPSRGNRDLEGSRFAGARAFRYRDPLTFAIAASDGGSEGDGAGPARGSLRDADS